MMNVEKNYQFNYAPVYGYCLWEHRIQRENNAIK